ncbi:acyl-CoA thioesterase [Thermodesulfobacterium sp. TA1]|uniref:acyl-CoA thioesterase n=1 Tax=Thermodesulfobacterium sp. TA1 TaxID=2234087 RepID=UPI0012318CB4|nr:thioesterase family protein [Thermodesulfobacterium sp. TA1]QER42896.1 acyl-CoA thioesterase [Thermodesulfobacterium sp. TA1]
MERSITYRVIYGDTDCAKVMYHANYLRVMEIARTEFIRETGLSYKQIEETYQLVLPVVEAHVRYKAPAFYDDLLVVLTKIKELKPHKIVFEYTFKKENMLVAEGYTVHVPIDLQGKLIKFPEDLFNLLKKLV